MSDNTLDPGLTQHIRHESRKNFFINLVLNAAIAYLLLHKLDQVSAWGEQGYGTDLIVTAFLLSTIISGIFIFMYRRKRGCEGFAPLPTNASGIAYTLPFQPLLASITLGLLGIAVSVPPLLGLLALLGIDSLEPLHYALIKGLWAGLLAAMLVPLAIRQGLRSNPL